MIHICAQTWYWIDINSSAWSVLNVFDGLSRWAVPAFVMISGALFLERTCSVRQLYTKYILRIATAFIFWSAVYAAIYYDPNGGAKGFILNLIKGHYHMWFLFLIAGLYMIVPFLRRIAEDHSLMRYFLILGITFGFIIPAIIQFLSIFNSNYSEHLNELLGYLNMTFVVGYPVYYVLGRSLNSEDASRKLKMGTIIVGIIGFAATVLLTEWISRRTGSANQMFYDYLNLNVLLESAMVFISVKELFKDHKPGARTKKAICKLSGWSFGAYLIHPLIIDILANKCHLNTISYHPVLSVPLILIIVAATSFAITAILDRIPYLRKYII